MARQAIALAPSLASAHLALATVTVWQLNIGGAVAEFDRGHALAGGDVDDLLAYADFRSMLGNQDEGNQLNREAQSRDPLYCAGLRHRRLARFPARGGLPRPRPPIARHLSWCPTAGLIHAFLATTLMELGKVDEAFAQLRQLPPDYLFRSSRKRLFMVARAIERHPTPP